MITNRPGFPALASLVATAFWLFASTAVFAQSAVLFQDAADESSSQIVLPDDIDYSRAIEIDASVIEALKVGDELILPLQTGQQVSLQLRSNQQYLNGDSGWRGTSASADLSDRLSLVVNDQQILATLNSDNAVFRIVAEKNESSDTYIGYLFTESQPNQLLNIDEGGVPDNEIPTDQLLFDVSALSGNDVTIVQTISDEFARIGQQIDFNIEVTNNLSSAINNEELNVLFILDDTDFISSSSNCSPGSTGAQSTIACTLPNIAPGSSTTVEYSVRLTEDSYPQIASGVFVGDVFGDFVRNDDFVFVYQDTLADSDGDGESDFNEEINDTNPNSAASVIADNFVAEIDIMFLYTDKFESNIGSATPESRINEFVETTNGYYADSDARISFRPIYYSNTSYSVNDDLNTTFTALRDDVGAFSQVSAIRENVGADIVVLVDGLANTSSICGLGTTPGIGFEGEFYHPTILTPDLYVTMFMPGNGCSDIVLAHELGHNLGLNHSHREVGAEGTFSYSLGHGVNGSFATIMANPDDFPGSNKVTLFSNPASNDCNGLACGVSRDDLEQGADAVFSLNQTRHQVARRRDSRVLPITSLSGSSNLIMYGAATRSSDSSSSVSEFSSQDSIDVSATLLIPSKDQGSVGETYAVISVAGAGLFYRDSNGGYQSWDGSLDSLQGTITARALNAEETISAFDNFVPASFGVDAASVTVFFAYSISGTDTFVYSSNGVPFTIQ